VGRKGDCGENWKRGFNDGKGLLRGEKTCGVGKKNFFLHFIFNFIFFNERNIV
jgi:hypothetical protein